MSYIPDRNEEGAYNKENLKDRYAKGYIDGMEYILEQLENYRANIFDDEDTTIGKMRSEITDEVFEHLSTFIDCDINEANVGFLESQDDVEDFE